MYATRQDMIDRFTERDVRLVTDRAEPPTGAINDAVLNQALEDAGAEIDGYLTARYALPFADPPKILKRWACDIAWFHLVRDSASETVIARYKSIVRALEQVNDGTLALGPDSDGETDSEGGARTSGPARVFTQDSLGDY